MKKIIGIFLIIIVGILLFFWTPLKNNVEEEKNVNILKKINQNNNKEETKNDESEKIIKKVKEEYNNDDVVGVIKINNTEFSAPLMQGEDNDYYLKHTPSKQYDQMGSIFLDYRVDIEKSKKKLIYGHNSDKIKMPFDILENYYDKNYYEKHKYIEIITNTGIQKYEIFSIYVEPSDFSYMKIEFANDEEYLKHIKKLQDKSIFDIDVKLSSFDEILIMQTCSTHRDYKKYDKKYLLIISRRV